MIKLWSAKQSSYKWLWHCRLLPYPIQRYNQRIGNGIGELSASNPNQNASNLLFLLWKMYDLNWVVKICDNICINTIYGSVAANAPIMGVDFWLRATFFSCGVNNMFCEYHQALSTLFYYALYLNKVCLHGSLCGDEATREGRDTRRRGDKVERRPREKRNNNLILNPLLL